MTPDQHLQAAKEAVAKLERYDSWIELVRMNKESDIDQINRIADRVCLLALTNQAEELRKENEWTLVADRMPEKAGFYLVDVDPVVASKARGTVEIGECYKTVDVKGMYEILKFHDYVIRWRPIPKTLTI